MSEDPIEYWKLCEELTVFQAASLIGQEDPADEIEATPEEMSHFRGYTAVLEALKHAIRSARLRANVAHDVVPSYSAKPRPDFTDEEWPNVVAIDQIPISDPVYGEWILTKEPNWEKTTVEVAELKRWLDSRGIRTGFFFQEKPVRPEYLEPSHPHYSPRLAAAVGAWQV